MDKIEKAFALFDAYNRQDPDQLVWEGTSYPREYFYALQLHGWVLKLSPQAGVPLRLASRCQHIGRWQIPRENYPMDKTGYFKWRQELARFHAETAGKLMEEAGLGPEEILAVRHILLKEHIRTNPEVQVMENALCLVFLQFQYEDFLHLHEKEKVVRILERSWKKMSEPGREAAMALDYSDDARALLQEAMGG